jgi:transposase
VFLEANAKPIDQCDIDELWRGEVDLELKQLDVLAAHLKPSKSVWIGKNNAQIQRVQTINGVGPVTAAAIVAYIDDPHRFKTLAKSALTRVWFPGNTKRAFQTAAARSPSEVPGSCEACWSNASGASFVTTHGAARRTT